MIHCKWEQSQMELVLRRNKPLILLRLWVIHSVHYYWWQHEELNKMWSQKLSFHSRLEHTAHTCPNLSSLPLSFVSHCEHHEPNENLHFVSIDKTIDRWCFRAVFDKSTLTQIGLTNNHNPCVKHSRKNIPSWSLESSDRPAQDKLLKDPSDSISIHEGKRIVNALGWDPAIIHLQHCFVPGDAAWTIAFFLQFFFV